MKLYFVSSSGELLEYQRVEPAGMAPQEGCDMILSRCGQFYSAKSAHYSETPEEAYAKFIKGCEEAAQLWADKLSREVELMRKAKRGLASHITGGENVR